MNQAIITSIVRQGLLFGGGILVARGDLSSGELEAIVGALLALGASAWAIYTRRAAGIAADAAALPGVTEILAVPELANAVTSDKVVPHFGT